MGNIEFKISSVSDWSAVQKANEFVEVLMRHENFLLPERFDRQEPARFVFNSNNLSEFIKYWTSDFVGFHVTRKKPYNMFMLIDIWKKEHKTLNSIIANINAKYFQYIDNLEKLLRSVNELYVWGSIDHGYICHEREKEKNKYYSRKTYGIISRLPIYGGNRLQEGLPGIYWANYFGPLYVRFFGREKFLSVPAYYKEELSDGGFLLLTSESPFDYQKKKTHEFEKRIIDHLGREAFFEKRHPKKVCKVPEFVYEQKALGRPIEIVAFDAVSKIIPEPEKFIKEAEQLSKALLDRFQKLDYSPENLQYLDDLIVKKSRGRSEPWSNEIDRQLLKEFTAYYGEVLRRERNGKWDVKLGSGNDMHPIIVFKEDHNRIIEYPFLSVYKLWLERQRSNGLSIRFHQVHKK